MKPPKSTSLRRRIVLVILATSAAALALAIATFVAYDLSTLRRRLVAEVSTQAAIVGENCRAPLLFQDREAAQRTLSALLADSQVRIAALYSADGRLFAVVRAPSASTETPPEAAGTGHAFDANRLRLFHSVVDDGRPLGTVFVATGLGVFEEYVHGFRRAAAGVFVLALILSALLAYRLQRLISGPILKLASAAQLVSSARDYSIRVVPDRPDKLGQLVGAFNEMLRQIQLRDAELGELHERYELAVQGAQDGLWDWNLASGEIFYSQHWKEMLGFRDEEIGPRPAEWFDRIHIEDVARVRDRLDAHLAGSSPHFEAEYRMRDRDGGWLWIFSRGLAVRDATGRATRIAGSHSDVTARRGLDALTGLPNRVLFVDRLEAALERSRSPEGSSSAVLCVDLERRGLINDTLGRRATRDLLLQAAERIRGVLRTNDTIARFDGGEFAVLLENARDATAASRTAARIHQVLRPAFHLEGQELFTTAAIGIATSASHYERSEDALRDAGAALDRARSGGWGRTELFDEKLRQGAIARLELESSLRRAIEREELELFYQPIVSAAGRKLAGFEALLRWRRDGGPFVAPGEFIALAEETGLVVPLGAWALRQACRQLQEWRARFPQHAELSVSVNISGRQLAHAALVDEVEAALGESQLPPAGLKLEITESALIDQPEIADDLLNTLKSLGIGIWLDDFGTGFSSLAHLHRFPIEALKIDRRFVSSGVGVIDGDGDGEGGQRQMVRSIVSLARSLGLATVAEGVETESQLDEMSRLSCDFAQGNLLSPPLHPSDAEALLSSTP